MGQEEIITFLSKLKDSDNWFSSKQISTSINIGLKSTQIALRRMRINKSILFKKSSNKYHYFWGVSF